MTEQEKIKQDWKDLCNSYYETGRKHGKISVHSAYQQAFAEIRMEILTNTERGYFMSREELLSLIDRYDPEKKEGTE